MKTFTDTGECGTTQKPPVSEEKFSVSGFLISKNIELQDTIHILDSRDGRVPDRRWYKSYMPPSACINHI